MKIIDNETPKYRKKREKKSLKKADHKHIYDLQVLFHRISKNGFEFYCPGWLCSICGKQGDIQFFETEKTSNGYAWQLLTNDEILTKYKNLEIIEWRD